MTNQILTVTFTSGAQSRSQIRLQIFQFLCSGADQKWLGSATLAAMSKADLSWHRYTLGVGTVYHLVDAGVDLHGVDEAEGKKLNIVVVRII